MNIVDELAFLEDQGYENVHFYDDTINYSKKRIMEIGDLIIKRKLKISWSASMRVKPIDNEIAALLNESNCKNLCKTFPKAGNDPNGASRSFPGTRPHS